MKHKHKCRKEGEDTQYDGSTPVCPDLAKFHHVGKLLKVLGNLLRVYLRVGKMLDLLWHILYAIGQIFVDVNGQMLENNLAIWSHCSTPKENDTKLQVELGTLLLNVIARPRVCGTGWVCACVCASLEPFACDKGFAEH